MTSERPFRVAVAAEIGDDRFRLELDADRSVSGFDRLGDDGEPVGN